MIGGKKLKEDAIFSRKIYQSKMSHHKRSNRYSKLKSLKKGPKLESSMSGIFNKGETTEDVDLNISSCKLSKSKEKSSEINDYLDVSKRPRVDMQFLYTPKIQKSNGISDKIRKSGGVIYSVKAYSQQNYERMSTRLYYRRVINSIAKPLLIIYYDGILGFTRNQRFYIRPKIEEFLSKMSKKFQIVVVKWGILVK